MGKGLFKPQIIQCIGRNPLRGNNIPPTRWRSLAMIAPLAPAAHPSTPPTLPRSTSYQLHPNLDATIGGLKEAAPRSASLEKLLRQYDARAGRVLDLVLPNGSTSSERQKTASTESGTVKVLHVFDDGSGEPDVQESFGFFIRPQGINSTPCGVSCAHTLEQVSTGIAQGFSFPTDTLWCRSVSRIPNSEIPSPLCHLRPREYQGHIFYHPLRPHKLLLRPKY